MYVLYLCMAKNKEKQYRFTFINNRGIIKMTVYSFRFYFLSIYVFV